jgi:hypothetical protein
MRAVIVMFAVFAPVTLVFAQLPLLFGLYCH